MKLIVGLGNPGEKYLYTRHNAGFMFVDFLCSQNEVTKPWKFDKYANAEIAEVTLKLPNKSEDVILVKPQTFMNVSGKTVTELFKRHSLSGTDLIVAHDDLDFTLGDFKVSLGKGPKLHNGISSIENAIQTNEFKRARIGVDNRQGASISGETYVLSPMKEEELQKMFEIFPSILDRIFT